MNEQALTAVKVFTQEDNPKICICDHKLQGTGVFFQSVKLIHCNTCNGWQEVRKPVQY